MSDQTSTALTVAANPQEVKTKTLIIGGLIGALLGVGAALLLLQRAEKENRALQFNTTEGIKLGLLALGTLRQVTQLGGEKE
jgi:gas vesicle protein